MMDYQSGQNFDGMTPEMMSGMSPTPKKIPKPIIVVIAFFVADFILVIGFLIGFRSIGPDLGHKEISINIPQGAGGSAIARILSKEKVLATPYGFLGYIKFFNPDVKFQAGEFLVVEGASYKHLAEILSTPAASRDKTFRVIEGWSVKDIATYFEKQGFGSKESFYEMAGYPGVDYRKEPKKAPLYDWSTEFEFLKDKPSYVSLEGYLFPNTYRFAADATAKDVVRKLLKEFGKQTDGIFQDELAESGKTLFEAVTMASILESEVQDFEDRQKVSDLLWRRIDEKIGLQVDSSVNYITDGSTASISLKDRDTDSPYNTYKWRDLPLGPIANPGMDALRAAVTPIANDYWFFLTTPDGEVKYAKTFEEHIANRRFLK